MNYMGNQDSKLRYKVRLNGVWLKSLKPFLSEPDEQTCSQPVDIAFIMDASGSIGHDDFDREKRFVQAVAKSFGVSKEGSHVGVITYSDAAAMNIKFGQHEDLASFVRDLKSLPYSRGRTRIDLALQLASEELFTRRNGMRPKVPKIAVVITDGEQTKVEGMIPLRKAASRLHEKGIQVISLGIGSAVNVGELFAMVQREEDVFQAEKFDTLIKQVKGLSETACKASGKYIYLYLIYRKVG